MMVPFKLALASFLFFTINCHSQAFDDGKYSPEKYRVYDDGKYYRPLTEGKYIPGDEGKYTYIYRNTLYPAFPYKHQEGPNGGIGGNGGFGGTGGGGGFGPDGAYGLDGSYRPDDAQEQDESDRIQYIGRRIYAERYPYIHKVIKGLVGKYVSTDALFGETPDGSANHYNKVYADKETAAKCRYLSPARNDIDEKKSKDNENDQEFVTQYPPRLALAEGEKLGTYYSFKGTKVLSTVKNALNSKIKLEYEVFVRIVDEVTE